MIPNPGEFGDLGRWALHGPGLAQLDLTLHKVVNVTERVNVEFRAEVYNILNHTNFANPVSRLNDALGTKSTQLQPGQPYSYQTGGSTFGRNLDGCERRGSGSEQADTVVAAPELLI